MRGHKSGASKLQLEDGIRVIRWLNFLLSVTVGSKWMLANVDPDTSHHQVNVSHPLYAEVGSDVHFEAMVSFDLNHHDCLA